MGNTNVPDQNMTAHTKLNLIISCWLRECNITSSYFPTDIKQLMINAFIYQPMFDNKNQKKGKVKQVRSYDYLFKLLIVGDRQVGKTSLYERYKDDDMSCFISTIAIDFQIKTIMINGDIIKLQIWDLQWDRYRGDFSHKAVFRNVHGVLICYDITNKMSLINGVRKWNAECNDNCDIHLTSKFLVGCKCDDEQNRECQKQDVMEIANECGFDKTIETSATGNINIDKVFNDISDCIVESRKIRLKCPFYG